MTTLTQDAAPTPFTRYRGTVADQYHSLAQLLHANAPESSTAAVTMVGVTGCDRGVGVSTVAADLAVAAAQSSKRPALLFDMSSTHRTLAERFGMSNDLNLVEVSGGSSPSKYAKPSPVANLSLLALDHCRDVNAPRVDGGEIQELLHSLDNDFGFIVVDLPLADSPLCMAAAGLLDGVLLVMQAECTKSDAALRAKERLVQANAKLLGVIFNQHRQRIPRWLDARL